MIGITDFEKAKILIRNLKKSHANVSLSIEESSKQHTYCTEIIVFLLIKLKNQPAVKQAR
jgi:hypothetical protein